MLSPSVPTDDMDVSLPSNLPAGSEDDADTSSESDSDSDVSLYLIFDDEWFPMCPLM